MKLLLRPLSFCNHVPFANDNGDPWDRALEAKARRMEVSRHQGFEAIGAQKPSSSMKNNWIRGSGRPILEFEGQIFEFVSKAFELDGKTFEFDQDSLADLDAAV